MKKIAQRGILFLLTLCLFCCSSCSMYYTYEYEGDYGYGYSDYLERAFLGHVSYTYGDDTNIVLPTTYNGYDVKELGGYMGRGYPCPFYIDVSGWYDLGEDDSLVIYYPEEIEERAANGETFEYNDLILNVTLPPLLEEIANVRCGYVYALEYKDGEKVETPIVYRIFFSFTIDENNKYFYTEEGKLYYKKNNKIVDNFLYQE